ncbi:alpha-amylase family glycosyl hydrolase [Candidatus Neomarinimicrobiota bacterium]
MKLPRYIIILSLLLFSTMNAEKGVKHSTPDWARDLVIYEIATKGFTSPNGPESGTFQSLQEKMPYLEELGINAIWLTGHSSSDPKHFYGIWTQYACIEPDKLDPSLGTEADFKAMIATAHDHGIRIFLDTIEHGVMNYSPLIKEHPDWFKGGSWGMTDYDWDGDHPDLEEWWIRIWTEAVLDWGVDGFRCDMGLHRPDLWLEIRKQCAAAGKEIFILGESGRENISDANQRDFMLFNQVRGRLDDHALLRNLPAVTELLHQPFDASKVLFQCEVIYEDEHVVHDVSRGGPLVVTHTGMGEDVIGNWERPLDGLPDWTWSVTGLAPERSIHNVIIECPERSWKWQSNGSASWLLALSETGAGLTASGGNPVLKPRLRIISPSCHDCGWDGFPLEKNPYTALGSRHIMGYGVFLAPAIPIMMSGAEFNADYVPLPGHTPGLFGAGTPGTGRWLYGSWLQWDQLEDEKHAAMLKDVQRLLTIRREHTDLIHALLPDEIDIELSAVPAKSGTDLPVPYIISNGRRALLVVGNPTDQDVDVELEITPERLALPEGTKALKLIELWPTEKRARRVSTGKLATYRCTVPADLTPGGGLHVVRFEPVR